jgi:hypothetical protein
MRRIGLLAIVVLSAAAGARAQVIYNEFVQGDISDNRFAPTALVLSEGSNILLGFMAGAQGPTVDLDYFSITIPAGLQLDQIILTEYFSQDPVAFLAIQPGPIFPNDPLTVEPGDLMGWTHLEVGQVGLDVLAIMGTQGQGFTPPLPAGVYTFWAQQLGEPTDYTLDFVVTPAPGSAALLAAGGVFVLRRRRD